MQIGSSPTTEGAVVEGDRWNAAARIRRTLSEDDGPRRLEPSHAALQLEIVEWRRRALAPMAQQLAGGSHAETPFDGSAKEQPSAALPADARGSGHPVADQVIH